MLQHVLKSLRRTGHFQSYIETAHFNCLMASAMDSSFGRVQLSSAHFLAISSDNRLNRWLPISCSGKTTNSCCHWTNQTCPGNQHISTMRGKDKAACVALPKGSMIAANSSEILGSNVILVVQSNVFCKLPSDAQYRLSFHKHTGYHADNCDNDHKAICPSPVTYRQLSGSCHPALLPIFTNIFMTGDHRRFDGTLWPFIPSVNM